MEPGLGAVSGAVAGIGVLIALTLVSGFSRLAITCGRQQVGGKQPTALTIHAKALCQLGEQFLVVGSRLHPTTVLEELGISSPRKRLCHLF